MVLINIFDLACFFFACFFVYILAESVESVTNLHLFSESNTADFKMCGRSIRKVTENHTIFHKFTLRNIITSVFMFVFILFYTKHKITVTLV